MAPALIVEFPAMKFYGRNPHVLAAAVADDRWEKVCPVDDKTQAEFKNSLCSEQKIMGFDRVDTLAKAMVHEGLHLCKYVGGTGRATADKDFGDYLFCATVYGSLSLDSLPRAQLWF
jgi:hypothetical protein